MDKQLYFIRSGDYVKIGLSDYIPRRIQDLQTGNPIKLELLYSYHCTREPILEEQVTHNKFKKYKVLNEWFYLSDEIKNYIEKIKQNPRCRFNINSSKKFMYNVGRKI